MIPVSLQPEPPDFDLNVRQPGHAWLNRNLIALNAAPPIAGDLPNFWIRSHRQLYDAYGGQCAYLAIFFEWVTGASSTDHFLAKSKHAGDAYEWANYRLSTLGANRNKRDVTGLIDPFQMQDGTFVLCLLSGKISPGPTLSTQEQARAATTISVLDLDSRAHREMRRRHYNLYDRRHWSEALFRLFSPFVWSEARRQNLL